MEELDRNFIELLGDGEPSERREHNTLPEAIDAFVKSFSDFWSEGWGASRE